MTKSSYSGEDIPGIESCCPDLFDAFRQSHIESTLENAPTYFIAHVRFGTIVHWCVFLCVM